MVPNSTVRPFTTSHGQLVMLYIGFGTMLFSPVGWSCSEIQRTLKCLMLTTVWFYAGVNWLVEGRWLHPSSVHETA